MRLAAGHAHRPLRYGWIYVVATAFAVGFIAYLTLFNIG